MQWNNDDHQNWRIVDYTNWRDLENYEDLEHRSGVYIFADINHQVKYIWKAGVRRMVDEIKDAISRCKSFGATRVKALYTNSDDKALDLEGVLIDKYEPPNNGTEVC